MASMLFTLGHSNRPITEFIELLKGNAITLVVDVRTIPRSRHNPQFESKALARSLRSSGIRYRHLPSLGGRRKPKKDSLNSAWKNLGFRGYADYMQTDDFQAGLSKLIQLAAKRNVAIVCAEAVPWRCHRNLIADALVVRGVSVFHILSQTRNQPHHLTPWACVRGESITYPESKPKKRRTLMSKVFKTGDRVSWNSEAGRVRGRIVRKLTRPTLFKGYTHHASSKDPQYVIESEKTGHIALHRGAPLRKLSKRKSNRS